MCPLDKKRDCLQRRKGCPARITAPGTEAGRRRRGGDKLVHRSALPTACSDTIDTASLHIFESRIRPSPGNLFHRRPCSAQVSPINGWTQILATHFPSQLAFYLRAILRRDAPACCPLLDRLIALDAQSASSRYGATEPVNCIDDRCSCLHGPHPIQAKLALQETLAVTLDYLVLTLKK